MDMEQTAKLLRVFQEAYPHSEEPTPDRFELWHQAFTTNDPAAVITAARMWVMDEPYYPTVAGIRQKMREAAAVQARELSFTRRPDPDEHYPSFEDGRAIAAQAWDRDCERRGVEPDWDSWNRMMGLLGPAPKHSAR